MRRVLAVLTTSLVIGLGLLTLLGLLFPVGVLGAISATLIQLVVVISAVAVLIGVVNLLWVHLRRVVNGDLGWWNSLALFLAALAVIAATTLARLNVLPGDADLEGFLFNAVQVSVESALAGLMVFFLVYAAARMMRRRITWWALLFTVTLVLVLVGWLQIPELSAFNGVSQWIREVPASGGARGLLLGIALGVTTAGVRVLVGQDPSYRE